jgi:uncharacterized membrane protein HdeD (DUF308 family)
MTFSEMTWPVASVFVVGIILIAGGVISFIASLWHEEKCRQREIRRPSATVGRDCYREYYKS